MKKILALALALMMVLSLAACGGNEDTPSGSGGSTPGSSDNGGNTAAVSWENADVKEYEAEDFAELTNGVPEPAGAYTINAVSIAMGLAFDFSTDEDADAYLQLLKDNGFTLAEEIYGIETYENATHTVQFSGKSIRVEIKE